MQKTNPLSYSLLYVALMAAWPVWAQAAPERQKGSAPADKRLKDVVVTATRAEAEADAVAATITSLDRTQLDRRVIVDEVDLFRDEPDLAYARDVRRFGATRPNIRGLEDNRVLQLVDGVRLSDFYNGGGPTNFTMSAPLGASSDFLKRVEVLRGPASSLYGSDALGGVVGYLTLDVGDVLAPGEKYGARAKLSHTGADEGVGGTLLGAWRGEGGWDVLLGYSHKEAHETDNQGKVDTTSPSRTAPNPQSVRDRGALVKLALKPASGHSLKFTLEGRDQDTAVVIRRLSASMPKVTSMSGDDHTQRLRASLEWQHLGSDWYDRLTARLHHQTTETENFNRQTRSNTSATCAASTGSGNNCYIEQDFFFEQTHLGGGVQIEKGWGRHLFTAGLDLSRVETEQKRDARVWNLTANTFTKTLAGDSFPLRDFAPGHTDTLGLFVQDEIALDDRLTLTPALRYDWRKLEPEPDALSQAVLTATGKQAVEQTDGALSPKLAALWRFTPHWAVFGHLARGFRAPNYEEVNGHFRNTTQSYGVSPNPDLKPETSVGVELGLRLTRPDLRGQVAVYDNRYKDFIETVRLNCPPAPDPNRDPNCIAGLNSTNMAKNLNKVRIWGVEARGRWDFLPGWRLDGALAYTHGENEENDRPLDSIEPMRLTLALEREAGAWGASARLRAAKGVHRVNDYSGTTYSPWFRPPGYGVLDLGAWWTPHKNARLTLAVNNVFDKKYWLWSDIRQADARNPQGVDFYTQPGRNLAAGFEYVF
jgi:hemoglobin/transferrin/lactoferrin receptor protein